MAWQTEIMISLYREKKKKVNKHTSPISKKNVLHLHKCISLSIFYVSIIAQTTEQDEEQPSYVLHEMLFLLIHAIS